VANLRRPIGLISNFLALMKQDLPIIRLLAEGGRRYVLDMHVQDGGE
jgi:hypothetical protein